MNLILCVVATSILVTVVNSEKNVEEETEEMKRSLEQFKVKLEFIKQKVADNSQLQNLFNTAVADVTKIIETLSGTLKVILQQRIETEIGGVKKVVKEGMEEEKIKAELGKTLDKKTEETKTNTEKTTPKGKLKWVHEKLQDVIATLGILKSETSILTHTTFALRYASDFSKALDAASKVEEKAIKIKSLRYLTDELYRTIQNIGKYTENANHPKKAKELQQYAFSAVDEFKNTLKDVDDELSNPHLEYSIIKPEEQKPEETKKNKPKEKLRSVKEKLQEVITTLGDIKSKANPSDYLLRYIILTLRYADQLSAALDVALKVEEKDMDIMSLRNFAGELHRTIQTIGSYTEHAKHPEKARDMQQSAFRIVEEFSTTLKDLQTDLRDKDTPRGKLIFLKEKLQEITTTLDKLKNESITCYAIQSYADSALKYAGELSIVLDAALKEEKAINFNNLKKKTLALSDMTTNIGLYAIFAKDPEKAKELQQSAYRTVDEFSTTLKDLQADLSKYCEF